MTVLRMGTVMLDPERRVVRVDGDFAPLPPLTRSLLQWFMMNANQFHSVDHIIAEFWGHDVNPDTRARAVLRQQIAKIRKAIPEGSDPFLFYRAGDGYGLMMSSICHDDCAKAAS